MDREKKGSDHPTLLFIRPLLPLGGVHLSYPTSNLNENLNLPLSPSPSSLSPSRVNLYKHLRES